MIKKTLEQEGIPMIWVVEPEENPGGLSICWLRFICPDLCFGFCDSKLNPASQ